jgi:tubulin--tyrosine ligase
MTGMSAALDGYTVFQGKGSFSIYDAMAAMLAKRPDWTVVTDASRQAGCDLILGDRFDIDYGALRGRPSGGAHLPLVHYFRGSHRLTLKAAMARLMRDVPGVDAFMPRTYVIGGAVKAVSRFAPAGSGGSPDEMPQLAAAVAANPGEAWIVKPSAGCKGRGIVVTTSIDAIAATLAEAQRADAKAVFAVQRYLARPMLVGGRKFDIRVWALVAAPFDVYVFSQGSCRTASEPYDMADLGNPMVHLTNHGLQEESASFGEHEEGNELWYSALDAHVREQFPGKSFAADVRPQIHRLITTCLYAAKELLEVADHDPFRCFQLFGFDLFLDDALAVHLIEINGSPGSADRWLEPMVAGIVDVVVDSAMPPTTPAAKAAKAAVAASVAAAEKSDGEVADWVKVWCPADAPPYVVDTAPGAEDVVAVLAPKRK